MVLGVITAIVAVAMAVYQLLITQYLFLGPYQFLNIHLAFALVLVFLSLLKGGSRRERPILLIFLFLSLAAVSYVHIFIDDLEMRMGYPIALDLVIGIIIIVAIIFLCRKLFPGFLEFAWYEKLWMRLTK